MELVEAYVPSFLQKPDFAFTFFSSTVLLSFVLLVNIIRLRPCTRFPFFHL